MPLGSGSRQQQLAIAPGNSSFFISAGVASSNIALGSFGHPWTDIEVTNDSASIDAWIALGDTSSIAAVIPTAGSPANGYLIKPGQSKVIAIGAGQPTYLAAITASSTASLYITQGAGA